MKYKMKGCEVECTPEEFLALIGLFSGVRDVVPSVVVKPPQEAPQTPETPQMEAPRGDLTEGREAFKYIVETWRDNWNKEEVSVDLAELLQEASRSTSRGDILSFVGWTGGLAHATYSCLVDTNEGGADLQEEVWEMMGHMVPVASITFPQLSEYYEYVNPF